jgi:hypothetical protein
VVAVMKMLPEPLTTTAETAYGGLLHPLRPMEAARGVLSEPASVLRASVVVPGMPTEATRQWRAENRGYIENYNATPSRRPIA